MNFTDTLPDPTFWTFFAQYGVILMLIAIISMAISFFKDSPTAFIISLSIFFVSLILFIVSTESRAVNYNKQIQEQASSIYGLDLDEKDVGTLVKNADTSKDNRSVQKFIKKTDEIINLHSLTIITVDGAEQQVNLSNRKGEIILIDSDTTLELPRVGKEDGGW